MNAKDSSQAPGDIIEFSKILAGQCHEISNRLSQEAHRKKLVRRIARVIGILTGLLALIVGYIPVVKEIVGPNFEAFVPAVAAFVLIFGSITFMLQTDPPERFHDYSYYIEYYNQRITEILADDETEDTKKLLREVNRLAAENIRDAKTKWPWCLSS